MDDIVKKNMKSLWLCFHFPQLSLEVYGDAASLGQPVVIAARQRGKMHVHQCNARAAQLGVRPGMSMATADCLAEGLIVREQSPEREQLALRKLAAWAGQFSSHVTIREPDAIVLEIGSSLKLFDQLEGLRERLATELQGLHYTVHSSLGQTALAAQHLARAGRQCWSVDRRALHGALCALGIEQLAGHPEAVRGLHGTGIRSIGEVLALPMASLGKRWGPEFLEFLTALVSDRPAQLPRFEAPPQFSGEVEFVTELTGQQMLLFPLRRLLTELAAWLRTRQLQCESFTIRLFHRLQGATEIRVNLSGPGLDMETFFSLAKLKLERTRLPAPVLSMQLDAQRLSALATGAGDLFRRGGTQRHDLVDRLTAKLGTGSVLGLTQVSDHRPEFGWRLCRPGAGKAHATGRLRPTWLLARPEPLERKSRQLWYSGKVRLLDGPERIEAGWWSHVAASRDYYLARREDGARLWVFRDLQDGRWYCHGLFA